MAHLPSPLYCSGQNPILTAKRIWFLFSSSLHSLASNCVTLVSLAIARWYISFLPLHLLYPRTQTSTKLIIALKKMEINENDGGNVVLTKSKLIELAQKVFSIYYSEFSYSLLLFTKS